jgi:hypothetical protein
MKTYCFIALVADISPGGIADRNNSLRDGGAHYGYGFTQKKYLHLVARLRQRVAVKKRKGGFSGIVRAPALIDSPAMSGNPPRPVSTERLSIIRPPLDGRKTVGHVATGG